MYGGYGKAASCWSRDLLLSCLYKRALLCMSRIRLEGSRRNRRVKRRTEKRGHDGRKEYTTKKKIGAYIRRGVYDGDQDQETSLTPNDNHRVRLYAEEKHAARQNGCERHLLHHKLVMQREYLRVSEMRKSW